METRCSKAVDGTCDEEECPHFDDHEPFMVLPDSRGWGKWDLCTTKSECSQFPGEDVVCLEGD